MKFLSVLALTLVAVLTSAQAGLPSLVGTWKGAQSVSMLDRFSKGEVTLVITAQEKHLFRGQMSWKTTDGSKMSGVEGVAGVIEFDNKSVAFAQSQGGGILWGSLNGANKLDLIFVQATETRGSKTLAYRTTLTRVSK